MTTMVKKCLILGGTGFLGMNLCDTLLKKGYDVFVYGHRSLHALQIKKYFPSIHFIEGDFSTEADFYGYLREMDLVYHLISTTKPSNKNMMFEFTTNVLPTIRLLDACSKSHARLIYFSSGGTVYGTPRYIPIDEGHRTEPISAYGIHKLTEEKCIEYYGRTYGLDYQILRISNPYGPWQDIHGSQGVIPIFLAKILNGEAIDLWGDGSAIRDYIYVEDLMDAVCRISDYHGAERVFNVGSGEGTSLRQLINDIKMVTDEPVYVNFLPGRIQDVPSNILDTTLINREVGWKSTTSLITGLKKMIGIWDINRKGFFSRKD